MFQMMEFRNFPTDEIQKIKIVKKNEHIHQKENDAN